MTWEVTGELVGGRGALWLAILLNTVGKGSLLLALALPLGRLLPADRPAWRCRLWTVLFALLIALPASNLLPATARNVLPATWPWPPDRPVVTVVQAAPAVAPAPSVAGGAGAAAAMVTGTPAGARAGDGPTRHAWRGVVLVWLGGVALLLGRLGRRLGRGHRLARRGFAVPDSAAARELAQLQARLGLRRRVRLGFSTATRVPFVTGLRTWRLVLPAELADWPADRLRPILLHELTHIRRHDLARLVAGDLACALYWFQPLVWLAARRARLEQEMACDEAVCRQGIKAAAYARTLLEFAAGRPGLSPGLRVTGFARTSGLEIRLSHVLRPTSRAGTRGGLSRWLSGAASLAALAATTIVLTTALVASVERGRLVLTESPAAGVWPPHEARTVAATMTPATFPAAVNIHQAAMTGDLATIRDLLAADPALLDARDARGMTPLALAAWYDQPTLVAALLDLGADPDLKNDNGLTPLFSALDRGRGTAARILLDHGAETRSLGYNRRTLLHMAARAGDRWALDHLLAKGADINATDCEGVTPLDLAVWGHKDATAAYLVSRGARRSDLPDPLFHRPGFTKSGLT